MLTSLSPSSSFSLRNVIVTVNGRKLEAKKGETILELCDRNNIKIPRLCHHPNLPQRASCRVCLVECNNSWLAPACVTPIYDGLTVNTKSTKVQEAVSANLEMLLASHDERCTSCIANNRCTFRDIIYEFNVHEKERHKPAPEAVDSSTHSIQFDPAKCVLCGRCVRACESIVGQKSIHFANRGDRMLVQPTSGVTLEKSTCVKCGQCTLYCPCGAMTEKSQAREVLSELRKPSQRDTVCTIDPSVFVDISEAFGYPAGTLSAGKVITALHQLGFKYVFDGSIGNDILINLEAEQLAKKLQDPKAKFPLYSSNCPAFVNFIEQSKGNMMKQLSNSRSTITMLSGLLKNNKTKPKELPRANEQIYTVYIGSCTAKKDEIERDNFVTNGLKDTDVALTTRELVQMLKTAGISIIKLKDSKFDSLIGQSTGDAALVYASGGLAESVAKATYQKVTGKKLEKVDFNNIRGYKTVRVAQIDINGKPFKFAAVDQLHEAQNLMERIEKKDPEVAGIKYVEVTACPGGCVCGGGSPYPENEQTMKNRINAIYKMKEMAKIQSAFDSPAKKLITPDVEKILHTTFKARPKK
ncbi:2Fe-2S iron-sulfur cluster binding domain-containing protein [Histomonas meleagridis]|uniref:2Fe-2S iron-sulfur cluster binding domain-containing protein n=1 Tax=Histomonas meleagridis TaxID=135588 RepID=UPI003559EB38|nr:2Fe-2S iron-sulfur cluster binding domain-containing protein [Histomonas meleagridis]KAH0796634.1 2Fe-2S iron-sulfur cluster binding domain-containing protein [Histomonas meleagridis]